jgi:hypothetical protein
MPTAVTAVERPPWTRRAALKAWNRSIETLSLVATGAIAVSAAFRGISNSWEVTLLGLALVSALPAFWIGLARLAERRFLSRPPKTFLAAAFGFDVGGMLLVALAVVLLPFETSDAGTVLKAGGVLEGCGTLLLLAWFLMVLALAPKSEELHSL